MVVRPIDAIELQQKMCALCNQDYSDEPCEPSDCVFIRAINETPTLTPPAEDNNVPTKAPNEPLTLDELREMGGKPYWHVGLQEDSKAPHWVILDPFFAKHIENYGYGERWIAYLRPPEGEEET